MKKTMKIVALVVALVMVFAVSAVMLAACGDQDDDQGYAGGTFNIKVWTSEKVNDETGLSVADHFKEQIKKFNDSQDKYTFNATVEGVGEGEAASQMLLDVPTGADLFCFAQDQTARLVQAGALSEPGKAATKEVQESHEAGAVSAATVAGKVRAYPLTGDNGYYMYYDKSVITDSVDKTDLAALVKACKDAGKNFSMELEGSGWYTASFFFATGCHTNWTVGNSGFFTSVDDTFNSPAGVKAMKGMQILTQSGVYVNSSKAADLASATGSAVVVSGTWDASTAKSILGENLGVAELPSFKVGEETFHMGSFSGYKLLGVKPQTDANKAAGLSLLARYLTNEQSQLERFEEFGWGPSNKGAQENEKVQADPILTALREQNEYATVQGQIHGSWWAIAQTLAAAGREATSDEDINAALLAYETEVKKLVSKTEEELTTWSVIGSIGNTSWDADLEMEKQGDNVWITKDAYAMDDKTEWVFRMGADWNYKVGYSDANSKIMIRWNNDPDTNNLTLAKLGQAAGTYKLKLTLTFTGTQVTAATIEFIAA